MRPSSLHKALRKNLSGMTVPEVLISTGILGLVLLGVYSLISFAIRWQVKMEDSVTVYQRAFKASTRLSYDLGTGSQNSFIYEVDGLAFASARPDNGPFQLDSAGQLVWQRYIFYYLTPEGDFYRNEEPITPPSATLPSTPDLSTLKSSMLVPGQLMAEKVSGLQIIPGSGVSIRFTVGGDNPNRPNSITLENRVTFRQ